MVLNTNFKTIEEIKNTISYQDLYDWYDYYSDEPFDSDRTEIQLANLCQLVASFGKSKLKHSDFMVSNKDKKENDTVNIEEKVRAIFQV